MSERLDLALGLDVDAYIEGLFVPHDGHLAQALDDAQKAGLPAINVSANEGKLLHLIARIAGARRILEVGTLGGYSTAWLARAVPADGHVITLEIDPRHAEVARKNLARCGPFQGLIRVQGPFVGEHDIDPHRRRRRGDGWGARPS